MKLSNSSSGSWLCFLLMLATFSYGSAQAAQGEPAARKAASGPSFMMVVAPERKAAPVTVAAVASSDSQPQRPEDISSIGTFAAARTSAAAAADSKPDVVAAAATKPTKKNPSKPASAAQPSKQGAGADGKLTAAATSNKTTAVRSPGTASVPGSIPPVGIERESTRKITILHNAYRAAHNAPPLVWYDRLARQAAGWAAQCSLQSDANATAGEVMYATASTGDNARSLEEAVKYWYSAVDKYNFARPSFSTKTGGFSQLVWASSKSLGCAVKACNQGIKGAPWSKGTLVVCRYDPPGNVWGQFEHNVFSANSTGQQKKQPSTGTGTTSTTGKTQPAAGPAAGERAAVMQPGSQLRSGECLHSLNTQFRLCMEHNGNILMYKGEHVLWTSNTSGRSKARPFTLTMQADGMLVGKDAEGNAFWQSSTRSPGAKLELLDNGNMVITDTKRTIIWRSYT